MKLKLIFASLTAVALLTIAGCGGSGGSSSIGSDSSSGDAKSQAAVKIDNTCGLPNFQSEYLALINSARAKGATCGAVVMPSVGPVAWNANLQNAATVHSLDMASTSVYSHTGSDGSTPDQRIRTAGYNFSSFGENIDVQRTSVQSSMDSWMNSSSHCQNIMRREFSNVAVSCIANPASQWGIYWTMELGSSF